ncbi:MAG: sugar phosphate isomerase/epimerase [Planctomycetales bacterium]|nr:sugar phosphate isomerase/epimerase [Planctomycetales bacterium]
MSIRTPLGAQSKEKDAGHALTRRDALRFGGVALAAACATKRGSSEETSPEFRLKYILGSCMYGYGKLADIVPEVQKTGATALDIWPKVHGNQREQLDELGEEAFAQLLDKHEVKLGCITQYKLGPLKLQSEMRLAKRLGCHTIVCGSVGPKGLSGSELKEAVRKFAEQMKPHLAVAEETGVTIAIENHGNALVESPDSLKWLRELRSSEHLAIALAPYHLPQNETLLASLIEDLGSSIRMFYAWQHGMGCHTKLPKEQELLQMPGRGKLDFAPLLAALRKIGYRGWTEIFMHPVPRGIAILDSTEQVTDEINRSRKYLGELL